MKKITILSAMFLLLCSYVTKATVRTVSNNPVTAGQYTVVDSAIVHANVNDTIYVNGSPIHYLVANINKRITLIGAGYTVTGTALNLNTYIDNITIDSAAFNVNPVNGTHIIGINCQATIAASFITTNIHIERCAVGNINTDGGDSWIMENNIITGRIDLYGNPTNTVSNCIIRNNFFASGAYIWANAIQNAPGLLIDHNIMEGQIQNMNYATITNNIFFFADISASPNNAYNVYNNNITVYTSADVIPFGTNSGSGNQNNVIPANLFSNGLVAASAFPALLGYDWQVLSSSSGHNAATDGTDIGIYGGIHAMPNFTGASTLPQMTLLNISNSSILLNGTLNYEFKARKQN